MLVGSWVVTNEGISPLIRVITLDPLLTTPLVPTREPRSALHPPKPYTQKLFHRTAASATAPGQIRRTCTTSQPPALGITEVTV